MYSLGNVVKKLLKLIKFKPSYTFSSVFFLSFFPSHRQNSPTPTIAFVVCWSCCYSLKLDVLNLSLFIYFETQTPFPIPTQ